MRLHLDYFDQNETFGQSLPAGGVNATAVRSITLQGWAGDWCVLVLDNPIEYAGRKIAQVLVRSRWKGYEVGGDQPTSVFILLPRGPLEAELIRAAPEDFDFVAWGTVTTLAPAGRP